MLLAPLIIANFFYLMAFDRLPGSIRLAMAAGIGLGYLLSALEALVRRGTTATPNSSTAR